MAVALKVLNNLCTVSIRKIPTTGFESNQLLTFSALKEYRLCYMLQLFLIQTGLRISEALAIRRDDSSSYRTIMKLRKFKLDQNQAIVKYKPTPNKDDYLGNYLTPSTVRESMVKYCKWSGVEHKGTHIFRHIHAVLLLEAGTSIKYVSNRIGHKTSKQLETLI